MQRYDLFKKLADGDPLWVCVEDDWTAALARMKQFALETGSQYFIFDQSVQKVVATTSANGERPESTPPDPSRRVDGDDPKPIT